MRCKAVASPVPDYKPSPKPSSKNSSDVDTKAVQPAITPTADPATDLQGAIDLLNDERFADALPLLETLDRAQYRPHVVAQILKQARLDEAEHAQRLEAERQAAMPVCFSQTNTG